MPPERSARQDSNLRLPRPERGALAELIYPLEVPTERLELSLSRVPDRLSTCRVYRFRHVGEGRDRPATRR